MGKVDVPVSKELVSFYQSRIAAFEKEREGFATQIQQCSAERSHVYRLEQAANKAGAQVQQLQKALSDSQLKILEVKEQLLQLQAERTGLLLSGKQDKGRIQSLLALTQPVLHDVAFAKGMDPGSLATRPLVARRVNEEVKAQTAQATLRTVFLPNEEIHLLHAKLAAAQAQLAEQHEFSQERLTALLEDRQLREDAFAAHVAESSSKIEDLQSKLDQRGALLERTTRELLLCRHQAASAERSFEEQRATLDHTASSAKRTSHRMQQQLDLALELLPRQCADAVRDLGAAIDGAQTSGTNGGDAAMDGGDGDDIGASCREKAVSAAAEHTAGVGRRSRERAAQLEVELKRERTAQQTVGRQQQQRIRQLEQQLQETKARKRDLEYRRVLDIEGFANEMGLVRKQVASVERRVREVSLTEDSPDDDPLSIVEQLAAVRDQLDSVAAKILEQAQEGGS